MFRKIENLVEYYGIVDELPVLNNPSSFKQFCLHENLLLPELKPDVIKIVKVVSDITILNTRVIRTPKATSLEGQKLTGYKVLNDGIIKHKIEYIGETPSQEIHAVHFNTPFSTFIVLPEDFKTNTEVKVTGYIEDISVDILNKRNIFENLIILMVADI